MSTIQEMQDKMFYSKVRCPECNKKARWCENKEVYGRNYGESYMCYWCKDCDTYVGCHQNSDIPLGTMANRELRSKRMETHKVFDSIWKNAKKPSKRRRTLYKQFSEKFNKEVHIGQSDLDMCEKIIEFSKHILEEENKQKII